MVILEGALIPAPILEVLHAMSMHQILLKLPMVFLVQLGPSQQSLALHEVVPEIPLVVLPIRPLKSPHSVLHALGVLTHVFGPVL
jgi:hypothetical protein